MNPLFGSLRSRWSERIRRLARPRHPESLPVWLDRRRVYVLPTPFGLFYALLVAVMLAGALNYNNNPALLLALLLAASGLASLIAAHFQLSGLRLETLAAEPVAAGTPITLQLALSHRDTRARRGLRLDCLQSHGFCSIPAHEPGIAQLLLDTDTRGWLDLDRLRLSTTQPLGLARAWAWIWPDLPVLVYPRPELQGPPLPETGHSGTRSRLTPTGEDIHHLRSYRAGDPLRAIAWKHSARRDTLLVREFEQPLGQDLQLEWQSLSALPYEDRIRRLAWWVDLAEREGRRYRLQLPGQPMLGPGLGPDHRHLCLRALALLPHARN